MFTKAVVGLLLAANGFAGTDAVHSHLHRDAELAAAKPSTGGSPLTPDEVHGEKSESSPEKSAEKSLSSSSPSSSKGKSGGDPVLETRVEDSEEKKPEEKKEKLSADTIKKIKDIIKSIPSPADVVPKTVDTDAAVVTESFCWSVLRGVQDQKPPYYDATTGEYTNECRQKLIKDCGSIICGWSSRYKATVKSCSNNPYLCPESCSTGGTEAFLGSITAARYPQLAAVLLAHRDSLVLQKDESGKVTGFKVAEMVPVSSDGKIKLTKTTSKGTEGSSDDSGDAGEDSSQKGPTKKEKTEKDSEQNEDGKKAGEKATLDEKKDADSPKKTPKPSSPTKNAKKADSAEQVSNKEGNAEGKKVKSRLPSKGKSKDTAEEDESKAKSKDSSEKNSKTEKSTKKATAKPQHKSKENSEDDNEAKEAQKDEEKSTKVNSADTSKTIKDATITVHTGLSIEGQKPVVVTDGYCQSVLENVKAKRAPYYVEGEISPELRADLYDQCGRKICNWGMKLADTYKDICQKDCMCPENCDHPVKYVDGLFINGLIGAYHNNLAHHNIIVLKNAPRALTDPSTMKATMLRGGAVSVDGTSVLPTVTEVKVEHSPALKPVAVSVGVQGPEHAAANDPRDPEFKAANSEGEVLDVAGSAKALAQKILAEKK